MVVLFIRGRFCRIRLQASENGAALLCCTPHLPQVGPWQEQKGGMDAGAAALGGAAAAKPIRCLERRVSFRAPTTGLRFPGLPTSTRVSETQRATLFSGGAGTGEALGDAPVTHVAFTRRMKMEDVPYGAQRHGGQERRAASHHAPCARGGCPAWFDCVVVAGALSGAEQF